jgi:hypothetical protein
MGATETLLLRGQRWELQRGNHTIIVENAVNLLQLFCQERVTVNGEVVLDRQATEDVVWNWKTVFETTWLTLDGEERLEIQWRSGFMKVHARALLDGTEHNWTDYFTGKWHGTKGAWPSGPKSSAS